MCLLRTVGWIFDDWEATRTSDSGGPWRVATVDNVASKEVISMKNIDPIKVINYTPRDFKRLKDRLLES